MKKILALAIALGMSTSVLASGEEIIQRDKSGHTFHVGVSKLQGDAADAVSILFGSDDAVFSLGYDYTTKVGVIFGGYYMPSLLSKYSSLLILGIDAQALGFYSGYQFDNNLRLTGGLSFTNYDVGGFVSYSDTSLGVTVGLDYLVAEKFLIGARASTHDIDGFDGTTVGINLGYKS
ncbi:MAG: outer membrane beta-barrel protein [Enterovibrio sp.]